MPHLHFIMDAYGTIEENANNIMTVNELLINVAAELKLHPIMPPFLVPYYYCDDAEDGGVSAFILCESGHITIHTFPFRSCYFVDVLSDEFFSAVSAENAVKSRLYAERVVSKLIDRRMLDCVQEQPVDPSSDFGPHYMIEVRDFPMTMEWIYRWLDHVAYEINMLPISRPYVLFDNSECPSSISGLLVVAQSHIAVHYDIASKTALIDIFSCAFLEDSVIRSLLSSYFGTNFTCKLFSRGSKHNDKYRRKEARTSVYRSWRDGQKD